MREDSNNDWCRLRNNNGEWVSEARVLTVCEETAQTLDDLGRQVGLSLSRQTSLGIIWYYRRELHQLEEALDDNYSLLETFTDVTDTEEFLQSLVKANAGDAEAQSYVGFCYLHGIGVEMDEFEGATWLKAAIEQSDAAAQFHLGYCYREGEGVHKNEWLAVLLMRAAAEQGDELAIKFASDYEHTTIDHCLQAAERGNITAQCAIGACHYYGILLPKDYSKAVTWLTLAAEQGDYEAQVLLSQCYYHGRGVSRNIFEANRWIERATAADDADKSDDPD